MNPDEFNFFQHVPREPTNVALELIRSLEDRSLNRLKNGLNTRETREIFAEDELVRKKCFDEMRCEMPGQPRSTFLMVFSPDGTKVASTHGNHNIYVTDIKSGKNIKTLIGHPRTPWCIAFHPTSNQIVASGCLGGEVRIWDLSGGSEVWTAGNQSVIASIAFHPNDRVLVIATYNELYFWDWSRPEPFEQVATANPKEKIRYVAFDNLGHKLITGIANSPQTRWERVRAPVPVPRQAERSASPYHLRITPRLVNASTSESYVPMSATSRMEARNNARVAASNVPERERRITLSYRNLLREYEQLVQRYLKIYKPPTMIDRGTDPMEATSSSASSSTQAPESSNPGPSRASNDVSASPEPESEPQPSTSQNYSSSLMMPSRILAMKKQPTLVNSTQTADSRKHKSSDDSQESTQEKRSKSEEAPTTSASTSHTESATQTQSPRKLLVINDRDDKNPPAEMAEKSPRTSGVRILCPKNLKRKLPNSSDSEPGCSTSQSHINSQPSTSQDNNNSEDILLNIRPIAEEVRNRFLPIIKSLPACDRPKLIRRFENSRVYERMKFRQMCPNFLKKTNRHVVDTSSDSSSSSEDEQSTSEPRSGSDARISAPNQNEASSSTAILPEPDNINIPSTSAGPSQVNHDNVNNPSTSNSSSAVNNIKSARFFIMEIEKLLMSILQTEIEGSENPNANNNMNNAGASTSAAPNAPSASSNSTASVGQPQPTTSGNQEASDSSMLRSSPVYMSANRDQDLIRPSAVPLGAHMFRRHRLEALDHLDEARLFSTMSEGLRAEYPTRNSSIFARTYPRRRLFSHRISAFMPTRVTRTPMRYRRGTSYRLGPRLSANNTFALDELINFSERPDAEDLPEQNNPPPEVAPTEPPVDNPIANSDNNILGNMYTNIVQHLESSLNDVRNIRASNRPGETSDMLSSFSESLENIMNQSDTILRNLGGSMMMLPNYSPQFDGAATSREGNEPRASFNDPNFFVRDNATVRQLTVTTRDIGRSLDDMLRDTNRSVIESDHNYPRNPGTTEGQSSSENISPLMNSLHLTISYIQRQARLLRQQVESIERIDRAMFEVEQLQLIRQLIMESVRYLRSLGGESRSAGISSVRQMMAGTRISDSSPYESQTEGPSRQPPQPTPSTSSGTSEQPQPRRGRKTYPPSRLLRYQRFHRRSLLVNIFPRRYAARSDRGMKSNGPSRNIPPRPPPSPPQPTPSDALRYLSSYSLINSSSLTLMARRLEHLLMEQTRFITRPQENTAPSSRSNSASELGENIVSTRLHECALRMNRLVGNSSPGLNRFRNTDAVSVVVTQDGASRFGARHFLSLIIDGMTKHMEELGGANISQTMRSQIHSVLTMALLLSDLLLLQLVDAIPPPAGMNLDVERESLTSRIDHMCEQMLQNRFSGHSYQLTRNLQHMRMTMRHAYRTLGQTYNARRYSIIPNRQSRLSRRQLVNRFVRGYQISRGRDPGPPSPVEEESNPGPSTSSDNSNNMMRGWGNLRDLIMRYSDNTGDEEDMTSSTSPQDSRETSQRPDNISSNNSDDNDDDEPVWISNQNSSRSTNLYRSNNVNLVHNNEEPAASSSSSRPWNVPSVQVNDVPISEHPSIFHQRIMSQRQRLAERVSELRSFPQMSVLRPRFLHPLYASVNPFDTDFDDIQREANYDCDMITTVTPNHRIQVWDISSGNIPAINNHLKNVIVGECKIHNDASVDIAKDGTILVTLLPSGGYLNVTNRLGVYSLKWETLGQCLYTASFEQNAVSVSLSPLSRHLVVGLASRRVSLVPSDRWTMARIFIIGQKTVPGDRLPVLRELGQNRDSRATNYKSVNCIRWLPTSGQGLIYATNTGQLVLLT